MHYLQNLMRGRLMAVKVWVAGPLTGFRLGDQVATVGRSWGSNPHPVTGNAVYDRVPFFA